MPEGYQMNPATLENVAGALRKAGTTLGNLDGGPGVPDAGDVTGTMAAVLAKLLDDTVELATGINAAGDQVEHSRSTYVEHEDANSQGFTPR
jgi:hypothetical protein